MTKKKTSDKPSQSLQTTTAMPASLSSINERNAAFWKDVGAKVEQAIQDPVTIGQATARMKDEMVHSSALGAGLRGVKSLESHLLAQKQEGDQRKAQFMQEHGANLKIAQQHRSTQKNKAAQERISVETEDGERIKIASIIKPLALERDELGDFLKPKDLWEKFTGSLDEKNLRPEEGTVYGKEGVWYGHNESRRFMDKDAFRSALNRERKKSNKTTHL